MSAPSLLRVVIDTSVLIAALRSRNGASAEVLRLAFSKQIQPLLDYRVAAEYREVAFRSEQQVSFTYSPLELELLLDALEAVASPVDIHWRHRPLSPDPEDDRVLDLAINGGADVITTMNLRHMKTPAARFGILAQAPGDFINTIRSRGR